MSTRRTALRVALGAAGAWIASCAGAASDVAAPALSRPASLALELDRALARRKTLVLMVSLEGCPYCKLVRESYLVPLAAGGQPVIQIELAGAFGLRDLHGREATHAQVVRGFGVRLAPTVLFLGRGGAEVAARLTGVANPDFYGAYLQERVDMANKAVGA